MFVLCPHCQFLVGTDPRTGAPPPQCPKCGGAVQAPLPEAEAAPAPLDPFAVATLPSVAPETGAAVEPPAPAPRPRKPRTRRNGATARTAEQAATPESATTASPAVAADRPAATAAGVESVPTTAAEDAPAPAVAATPARLPVDTGIASLATTTEPAEAGSVIPAPGPASATALAPSQTAQAPSFLHRTGRSAVSVRRWPERIAVVALALLLALQLLLARRDALAADARWRPLVATLCQTLRCHLPPWREPAAFTMLHREVRPHPRQPGTLLVNASFRNDARWPQPWPHLLLTLSDLEGRTVGARAFTAPEYLGASPAQREIAPGQSAAVSLVVVEPAPNVVAFRFDFR